MEEKNKSKSIVEAGIMSAITFVLMMLTSLPGIGTIISFAIPIPIALLYLKYNLKTSICSIVISGILIGFFISPLQLFVTILIIPFGIIWREPSWSLSSVVLRPITSTIPLTPSMVT